MVDDGKLSRRRAIDCELAKTPTHRCRCRCGGELHGAARVRDAFGLDYLPWLDPHFPSGGHPRLPLFDDDPTTFEEVEP